MDWKTKADGTEFHKAKDVAAFANHLGGTLLVGAHEQGGQLAAYIGISPAEAGSVRDGFSKAVKDRCQPPAFIDFEEYEDPNNAAKRIVAVNVWPSLALIGVRLSAHKPSEGYGGDSFVYPVRAGTDSIFLTPIQIPMYMTPQVRRVVVMLSRLPKETTVIVEIPARNHRFQLKFLDVREEESIARFGVMEGSEVRAFPLDCITTVFEGWSSETGRLNWQMYVHYTR